GMTASFYHQEILANYDAVDAIIRGEAEIPISALMDALREGRKDFGDIPNLSWRNGSEVVINPLSYVASHEILDDLNFTHFDLLKNHRTYIRYMVLPFYVKGVSKEKNFWMYSLKSPMFDLEVGRGCPVNCTWCSGSRSSQERISGRQRVIFRSPEKVIQSIEEALSYGYETMHICFDPFPRKPDYYLDLFSRIRAKGLRMECFYESFGLPTAQFIREFAKTFPGVKSFIALSPEVGSERVRRANKGYFYTNGQLMETLDVMRREGVYADLFFTYGVAWETERDLRETLDLIKRVKEFPNVRGIRAFSVEMEPGAPWQVNPDAYGIEGDLKSFEDFMRHHADEGHDPFAPLGYTIPDYFEKSTTKGDSFARRIQRFKCRHLCFIHPNAR
ncbi:MAG: radical SAM protein, partial [Deltaproteobacteria bacterium]|nr:radical SAM protein [Deltaproteobacteria bacterium]